MSLRHAPVFSSAEAPVITQLKLGGARLVRVVVAFSLAVSTTLPFVPSSIALADASNNSGTSHKSTNASPASKTNIGTPITPKVTPINPTVTPTVKTKPGASPAWLPSSPTGLVIVGANQQLRVTWDAAASSDNVTGYAVQWSTDARTWTEVPAARTSTESSVVIEGLTNGMVTYVQVAAINALGTSPAISSSGVPAATATAPRSPAVVSTPPSGTPYADAVRASRPKGFWQLSDTPGATTITGTGTLTGTP